MMQPKMRIEDLKLILKNGMKDAVQQMLDADESLQYKIEKNNGQFPDEGEWILVPMLSETDEWLKKFITVDPETKRMLEDVKLLSKIDDEVLITGESGTGKEIIARALHGNRTGAFKRINCGALPEHLIESELFGHVKGAFTGADTNKIGLMRAAKDGVLFLDEIGDLPYLAQAKLLNALQPVDGKRYIRPVGSTEEHEINCRVVCATHKPLESMIISGSFRLDLYARVSTFELKVRPLWKRECDIEPIVIELCKQSGIGDKVADVLEMLNHRIQLNRLSEKCEGPGNPLQYMLALNVRSLEQMVKRYKVLGRF